MIPLRPVPRLTSASIENFEQVVRFLLPLPGTPYTLHYRSDTVPGRIRPAALRIPIGPRQPLPRLKAVLLEIDAPGQRVRQTFEPSVRWYRHELPSATNGGVARVRVGRVLRGSFPRPEMTRWREYSFPLVPWDARELGLGGWTLNVHHRWDETQQTLRLGDGGRERVQPGLVIKREGEIEVISARLDRVFLFHSDGRHQKTLDAMTRAAREEFTYGTAGSLVSFRDPAGRETRIVHERSRTRIVGPAAEELILEKDDHGFLRRLTTPGGQTFELTHSSAGLLRSVVAPGARRHAFEYDSAGRVIRQEMPNGNAMQIAAREEGNHQSVALIDRSGAEAVSERELRPTGEIVRRNRCCGGMEMSSVIHRDGSEEISQPDGTRVLIRNGSGWSMQRTYPASKKVSEWKYTTENGRRILEANGRRYESVTEGRSITFTTPEGRRTVVEVSESGRPLRVEPWHGPAIEYRRDAAGRITEIVQGDGREQRSRKIAYDAAGRPSELRDAMGRVTQLTFDEDDRLVRQSAPDGEASFLYAASGVLEAILWRGARLPVRGAASPVLPDSQLVFAPGSGQLTRARSADGIDIVVSSDGPLITGLQYAGAATGSVLREFDADMRLSADEVSGSPRVHYRYDRDGLITQAGRLSIERDAATGRITRKRLGNAEIQYQYNGFGELVEMRCHHNGREIYSWQQHHDALGRVVQRTERMDGQTRSREYAYDVAGRLSSITAEGRTMARFQYDENGNRLAVESAQGVVQGRCEAGDRLTQFGAWRFEHDAAGNRTSVIHGSEITRYAYGPAGSLREISLPDGSRVAYRLDAVSRVVLRTWNGVTETFLYDHSHRLLGIAGDRGRVTRFVFGTHFHVPDYAERDGRACLLVGDAIGTPRLTLDVDSGAVIHRADFDEDGNIVSESGERVHPFGFAGGVYDPQTGLVRFGLRYYDPLTARWTQPDPLGVLAGTNLYEYVNGDPINRIDPLGLEAGGGDFIGPPPADTPPANPHLAPGESGGNVVDFINNPSTPKFDITTWLTTPKAPEFPGQGGFDRNAPPTRWDFGSDHFINDFTRTNRIFRPGLCFGTSSGSDYRTDDSGGLARNPNRGGYQGGGDYNMPGRPPGIGIGIWF